MHSLEQDLSQIKARMIGRIAPGQYKDPEAAHLCQLFLDRFIGLRPKSKDSNKGVFVEINSRGLSLDQKIALEQFVANSAQIELEAVGPASVFFKKNEGHRSYQVLQGNNGPEPVKQKESNLPGLNIARRPVPGVRNVLLVASGKGGVGKSTIAASIALALSARGQKVGILDADLYGPSIPTLLGLDQPLAVDEQNKLIPAKAGGLSVVSSGLLIDSSAPLVWRGPMLSKLLSRLFFEANWDGLDTLVVDLPPGTGDVQLTILEQVHCSAAIMVTTNEELAYADVIRAATMFKKTHVPLIGLVANMKHGLCAKCGHSVSDTAQSSEALSKQLGIPFLGEIPMSQNYSSKSIRESIEKPRTNQIELDSVVDIVDLWL